MPRPETFPPGRYWSAAMPLRFDEQRPARSKPTQRTIVQPSPLTPTSSAGTALNRGRGRGTARSAGKSRPCSGRCRERRALPTARNRLGAWPSSGIRRDSSSGSPLTMLEPARVCAGGDAPPRRRAGRAWPPRRPQPMTDKPRSARPATQRRSPEADGRRQSAVERSRSSAARRPAGSAR